MKEKKEEPKVGSRKVLTFGVGLSPLDLHLLLMDPQLTKSEVTCPMCWTPVALSDMQSPVEYALDVLVFDFECKVCSNTFVAAYERIGDKVAWKSRVFV